MSNLLKLGLAFCILIAIPCATYAAAKNGQSIIGSWRWDNQFGDNYFVFVFKESGEIETTLVEPNGRAKGIGEALGSYGHFRLRNGQLIITRAHVPADAWPSKSGDPPFEYKCRMKLAPDRNSFELSNCSIPGTWTRQST